MLARVLVMRVVIAAPSSAEIASASIRPEIVSTCIALIAAARTAVSSTASLSNNPSSYAYATLHMLRIKCGFGEGGNSNGQWGLA